MSAPHKHQWDERVEKYAREFNSCRVVDLPSRVQKITQRDTMLDYIQQCEREYASTNEAQRQADVVGPLVNTRRSAASKQGSVAMRRASRVIQAEALKAVTAQMMAQKAN